MLEELRVLLYILEPEIPIIPEGDDLFDGENNSSSETKDAIPNSSIQPPEVPTKSKDASEGDINPETGEVVQDEKHVAEEEDHKQELLFKPATVSFQKHAICSVQLSKMTTVIYSDFLGF